MEFLANRWVYTGDCKHRAERRIAERIELLRKTRESTPKCPECHRPMVGSEPYHRLSCSERYKPKPKPSPKEAPNA